MKTKYELEMSYNFKILHFPIVENVFDSYGHIYLVLAVDFLFETLLLVAVKGKLESLSKSISILW